MCWEALRAGWARLRGKVPQLWLGACGDLKVSSVKENTGLELLVLELSRDSGSSQAWAAGEGGCAVWTDDFCPHRKAEHKLSARADG